MTHLIIAQTRTSLLREKLIVEINSHCAKRGRDGIDGAKKKRFVHPGRSPETLSGLMPRRVMKVARFRICVNLSQKNALHIFEGDYADTESVHPQAFLCCS